LAAWFIRELGNKSFSLHFASLLQNSLIRWHEVIVIYYLQQLFDVHGLKVAMAKMLSITSDIKELGWSGFGKDQPGLQGPALQLS
jgi:hypothetical protein